MSSQDIRNKVMSIATGFSSGLDAYDPRRNFDRMTHPGLSSYLMKEDLLLLKELATNPKYAITSNKEKLNVYDQILCPRGFKRTHSGTNRIVYSHVMDNSFILKVALDKIGVNDNKSEFYNQEVLKPFIPKVFDIADNGSVILMEKVYAILNKEEFVANSKAIFNLIVYLVGCGYIMEDIGTQFFMNWGIRSGFGPVLLDFPYVYRINKSRLICIQRNIDGSKCSGKIEYDDGFNFLQCTKCGKRYAAKDIGSSFKYLNEIKYKIRKEDLNMNSMKIIVKSDLGNFEVSPGNGTTLIDSKSSESIINNAKQQAVVNNNKQQKFKPVIGNTNESTFTKSNDLMIDTILKEYGYNSKDISDEFKEGLINIMTNSTSTYININHKVVSTAYLNGLTPEEKVKFENNIKNLFHTNKLRVVENELVTDYYSPVVYYNQEKLRDIVRAYVERYQQYILNKNKEAEAEQAKVEEPDVKPEEPAKEEEVPTNPIVDNPNKLEMEFPNPNTLGSPVITAKTAVPDVGKRSTALDNF